MELKNVLNQLKESAGTEKTAAAGTSGLTKTAVARNKLKSSLDVALKQAEKVSFADTSASDSLEKMASDLASADREVMIKEANLYGAAIMDGFIARGTQYGVDVNAEKTASADDEDFVKWAQANPEEFQRNFAIGHQQGSMEKQASEYSQMEKWASTAEGYHAMEKLSSDYSAAHHEVVKIANTVGGQEKLASLGQGYDDTVAQLTKIASEVDGHEKIAAIAQGFEDGTAAIVKLAEDTYVQGFNNTVDLLRG